MNLLKELLLNEGFSDYSVMGSDTAADAFFNLCDKMADVLQAALKEKGNAYNTAGPLNVAMIYVEFLMPFSGENEKLSKVAKMTLSLLEEDVAQSDHLFSDLQAKARKKYVAEENKLIKKLKKFK